MACAEGEHVLRELEPSVERLLGRHLAFAQDWLPHQFVPWSAAQDFDGPLGGAAWELHQSALPRAVQDALVINLLTEDNLPSYHFEIATRLRRDGAWGAWVHRWTAEEDRHAGALRAFIHARRAVDPVALERLRMSHMETGWSANWLSPLHCLAYVTVQELATRQAHRNTGALCGDRVGEALMARIAADENLHMLFYRGLYHDALQAFPDEAMAALADVLCGFEMPGTAIAGFRARAARVAAAGIFNLDIHYEHVVLPLLRALGVMEMPALGPAGQQAQSRIGLHVEALQTRAARARDVYARMNADGTHR
ncbi:MULTISPECIES: acyl-ACP desaturase [unclassified Streptomyces]|uniref:acyl-ACP desaturase n=1 Tax=unclassified Streptomyces TaxID=2593676 RepID=UPI002E7A65B6|nr:MULTISPECIES: acyl-ACP desaturase [unclassified Streptomyces]MEE1757549.1 acyl-ACP desaturase [Streptomyces sp. SP18BB07]MEE1831221.1 acyl-ACP desaturase [Streptomyces sp. SP17KL33]